jgi:hypothetical protein
MFGNIGENSTPGGGHTNRDDVNKLGYLFGGKGNWLNSALTSFPPAG